MLTTPVGEVRGKQAVIGYFTNAAATLEYDSFVRPLEYYGDGSRVVQVGAEIFTVKATGATHEADWARGSSTSRTGISARSTSAQP